MAVKLRKQSTVPCNSLQLKAVELHCNIIIMHTKQQKTQYFLTLTTLCNGISKTNDHSDQLQHYSYQFFLQKTMNSSKATSKQLVADPEQQHRRHETVSSIFFFLLLLSGSKNVPHIHSNKVFHISHPVHCFPPNPPNRLAPPTRSPV